jgi:molybdate transport system substrate-binding protein
LERLENLMSYLRIALAGLALMVAMRTDSRAGAAEIRVLSSGSLKSALSRLLPDFQKSSGNTATIEYGPAGAIAGRIDKSDAADVVIVSKSQLQKLESNGKVVQGSLIDIAGIALGVAVRKERRNRISAMSTRSNEPCSPPGRSGTAIR